MKGKIEKKVREPITIDYENKRLSVFYFIPLLLIAGFVPLIVYAKYIDLTGTAQSLYWTGQQQYLDFFSYWKSRWVIVLTAIALIFYIILYKQKKLPFKYLKQYYIPLGIYAILVIISTVFALDTQTALWGFVDMYQGMFVLLSYALITFLTINFVNNERDVNLFVKVFLFLMIVEGVIGVGQYFGFDFFQTKIGNNLILPDNLAVDDLSFSFGPKTIYGTLFNTNFVGSFATLMMPLSVAFFLGAKTNMQRIISAIATILMIFVWIGCNSRAGYLGIVVAFALTLILLKKIIRKHFKKFVGLVVVFFAIFVAFNYVSGSKISDKLKVLNVLEEFRQIKEYNKNDFKFEDIILNRDTFSIKTSRETLNFKVEGDKLYFFDENYNKLEIDQNGNSIIIKDKDSKYYGYSINLPDDYPGIVVGRNTNKGTQTINFYMSNDGIKIIGTGGRLTRPVIADRFRALDGLENIASDRGYIWGRSIPLLEDYLVVGAGADNYPLAFPQDDIAAKLSVGMNANTVVDKPHNLYLQIATNTGMLSLVSILLVWGIYIISSYKLYSKLAFDSLEKYLGASCYISIIGYLSTGMFNDSVVSVAPLFWIIFGLGISINLRLKNKIS